MISLQSPENSTFCFTNNFYFINDLPNPEMLMCTWSDHNNHARSIRSVEASPEIPFSPARRPKTHGLLKNKVGDPSIVERPPEEICKGQGGDSIGKCLARKNTRVLA